MNILSAFLKLEQHLIQFMNPLACVLRKWEFEILYFYYIKKLL